MARSEAATFDETARCAHNLKKIVVAPYGVFENGRSADEQLGCRRLALCAHNP